ncbi:MAG TPA: chemotaxis response regulator protein-glutamate methylesterase [Acidobacteriaceae bacterium]|nr:chemotaxis response regulator protein-glutamate methylesterase [Acidobacteriaceae bacterium]
MNVAESRIKVLVVDDSAIVRKILTETIAAEPDMEVVGTAPDPYVARDKILALNPDVLTLDIEMPRMDGLTFLKKLMLYHPMPVIVISSLGHSSCEASVEALRHGAIEVLAKPGGPYSIGELRTALAAKLRAAASARIRNVVPVAVTPRPRPPVRAGGFRQDAIIAIGASTGGTEAIREVLMEMPADTPPIVITQHIPQAFSAAFAGRLNQLCAMEVREARDGDEARPGLALVAPGNYHMLLRRAGAGFRVQVQDGPQVCYQRPSVDVLFASVAESAKDRAVGALLTGMGCDGAQGLLRMKRAGARTIAQNEESCVVYGMPREAVKLGAADQVMALSAIPHALLQSCRA